jgi:hypothetical protein
MMMKVCENGGNERSLSKDGAITKKNKDENKDAIREPKLGTR